MLSTDLSQSLVDLLPHVLVRTSASNASALGLINQPVDVVSRVPSASAAGSAGAGASFVLSVTAAKDILATLATVAKQSTATSASLIAQAVPAMLRGCYPGVAQDVLESVLMLARALLPAVKIDPHLPAAIRVTIEAPTAQATALNEQRLALFANDIPSLQAVVSHLLPLFLSVGTETTGVKLRGRCVTGMLQLLWSADATTLKTHNLLPDRRICAFLHACLREQGNLLTTWLSLRLMDELVAMFPEIYSDMLLREGVVATLRSLESLPDVPVACSHRLTAIPRPSRQTGVGPDAYARDGVFKCARCSMWGPSDETGQRMCAECSLCEICCGKTMPKKADISPGDIRARVASVLDKRFPHRPRQHSNSPAPSAGSDIDSDMVDSEAIVRMRTWSTTLLDRLRRTRVPADVTEGCAWPELTVADADFVGLLQELTRELIQGVSAFEFVHSGVVSALVQYLQVDPTVISPPPWTPDLDSALADTTAWKRAVHAHQHWMMRLRVFVHVLFGLPRTSATPWLDHSLTGGSSSSARVASDLEWSELLTRLASIPPTDSTSPLHALHVLIRLLLESLGTTDHLPNVLPPYSEPLESALAQLQRPSQMSVHFIGVYDNSIGADAAAATVAKASVAEMDVAAATAASRAAAQLDTAGVTSPWGHPISKRSVRVDSMTSLRALETHILDALRPSPAVSFLSQRVPSAATPEVREGCDDTCSMDHSSDGPCLVCGEQWAGQHMGHDCVAVFSGRGSWRLNPRLAAAMASFRIGDRVRVIPSVGEPRTGWGRVKPNEVGRVTALEGTRGAGKGYLTVNMPSHPEWVAHVLDMEHVDSSRTAARVSSAADVARPTPAALMPPVPAALRTFWEGNDTSDFEKVDKMGARFLKICENILVNPGEAKFTRLPCATMSRLCEGVAHCEGVLQHLGFAVDGANWVCAKPDVSTLTAFPKHLDRLAAGLMPSAAKFSTFVIQTFDIVITRDVVVLLKQQTVNSMVFFRLFSS